jgi:hypothetical protein
MIKEGIDMYYVYVHKRKGTNKIFYVGKGTKSKSGINRVESDKNRNIHWHHVVDKDGGYDYEILHDDLTESESFEIETQLINEIGLEHLVNMTDGGSGGDTLTNHPNIDEIGKKISEHHKGEGNPNYGKGYVYWWEKKYGKEKAKEMLKELNQKHPKWHKGTKGLFTTGLNGDRNPAKRDDIRLKISDKKKEYWENQKNNKVECPKCGKMVLPMNINRHQLSKTCK